MKEPEKESFMKLSSEYLDVLGHGFSSPGDGKGQPRYDDFINLFRTASFIQRERE
jgi:hypothetical protein